MKRFAAPRRRPEGTPGARSINLSARSQLLLPLLAALLARLVAWLTLPYPGQISDEAEYLAAASWLAQGRGFSFFKEWIWTRPPLYVLFLAGHIRIFGPANLWPIRISQTLISVCTVALAMGWAALLAPRGRERRVAILSGWAMALAYSFATYAFLMLSETLFLALLLLGLLLLTLWAQPEALPARLRPPGGRVALLAAGGIVLGLGALTRALLAGVLPVVAAWVWWQAARPARCRDGEGRPDQRHFSPWRGMRSAAVLTVATSAMILPWSFYNSRFFATGAGNGDLILIDTTGGYNAMLGAQAAYLELEWRRVCEGTGRTAALPATCLAGPPTRDEDEVYAALKEVDDHAERQALAYRTAWQWIRANPAGFARKTGRELVDLLTINYGGAERMRGGYTQGATPVPHLLGLLLDDTLYLVAAPLAVAGLALRARQPGKGLALAWLAFNLATGPLFFAINRFRLPLLPILFVYAACAVVQEREPWPAPARRRLATYGASALFAILLPSFLYVPPAISPFDRSVLHNTYLGISSRLVARGCVRGEAALEQGDVAAAQRFHDRGHSVRPLDCFALLQARIWMREGQHDRALALLQSMSPRPERFLLEGEIYRDLGDRERAVGAFVVRDLEIANPTRWAWEHLDPPRAAEIDLGSGLDWGYVDGFYGREGAAAQPDNYRWTGPVARLRFVDAGSGQPQTLRLRVAAYRPGGERPAILAVTQLDPAGARADARLSHTFDAGAEWQVLEVPLAATAKGEDVLVELRSTTFVPGPAELQKRQGASEQLRLLGVQVDRATLVERDAAERPLGTRR